MRGILSSFYFPFLCMIKNLKHRFNHHQQPTLGQIILKNLESINHTSILFQFLNHNDLDKTITNRCVCVNVWCGGVIQLSSIWQYKLNVENQSHCCIHQRATESAVLLIVWRRRCLGSWPCYSWHRCFLLMNADKNSKAILKSGDSTRVFTFYHVQFRWHIRGSEHGKEKGNVCLKIF